jgi:hypothetical protein
MSRWGLISGMIFIPPLGEQCQTWQKKPIIYYHFSRVDAKGEANFEGLAPAVCRKYA